jgi:hypothetical protein
MQSFKDVTAWMYPVVAKTIFDVTPEILTGMNRAVPGFEHWGIKRSIMEHTLIWADNSTKTVLIAPTSFASLWCLAYLAFGLQDSQSMQRENPQRFADLPPGQVWASEDTARYRDFIMATVDPYFSIEGGWPAFLARPHASEDLTSDIGRVNNIFRGAVSWWILQVIYEKHLFEIKDASTKSPTRCQAITDEFATSWIMQSAGVGLDKDLRVMSILVAQMWFCLKVLLYGEEPNLDASAVTRFRNAISTFNPQEQRLALELASEVVIPILFPEAATAAPHFDRFESTFNFIFETLQRKIDTAALATPA